MCAAGRARTANSPGRARYGQNHAAATATKSEKRTCTSIAKIFFYPSGFRTFEVSRAGWLGYTWRPGASQRSHQAAAWAPRRDAARSDSDLARNGSTSAAGIGRAMIATACRPTPHVPDTAGHAHRVTRPLVQSACGNATSCRPIRTGLSGSSTRGPGPVSRLPTRRTRGWRACRWL